MIINLTSIKTPQVGFEPTTYRLTADRSTAELLGKIINKKKTNYIDII